MATRKVAVLALLPFLSTSRLPIKYPNLSPRDSLSVLKDNGNMPHSAHVSGSNSTPALLVQVSSLAIPLYVGGSLHARLGDSPQTSFLPTGFSGTYITNIILFFVIFSP